MRWLPRAHPTGSFSNAFLTSSFSRRAFGSARSDADGLRIALAEARVAAEAAAARAAELETAFSAQVIMGVYLPSSQHDAAVRTLRKLSFK